MKIFGWLFGYAEREKKVMGFNGETSRTAMEQKESDTLVSA